MRSFRSILVGCLLLHGFLASELYQNPPSAPSIYTFDNWRELKHTDKPTNTDADVPHLPVSESWKDPTAEIFVGIVSYRDRRCSQTLANLFDKAEFPDRVRVGEEKLYFYNSLFQLRLIRSIFTRRVQVWWNKCRQKKIHSHVWLIIAS